GILKVDGFVNHQVDPRLMDDCGQVLAARFANVGATKVLTAEISGIAPALTTALHLGLPVVYARKQKPVTMPNEIFLTLAPGQTILGLARLAQAAGARVVGIGTLIEKSFEGGRAALDRLAVPIESLAI